MNLRRAIALLLLGTQAACHTGPQLVQPSPRQYLSANNPKKLWLTLNDGRKQIVIAPRVIADTVFGWNETGEEDLTIPIDEVKELQATRLAVFRTALIPAMFLAAGIAVYASVKAARGTNMLDPGECLDLECEP